MFFRRGVNAIKEESLYIICVPQVAFYDRLLSIEEFVEMLKSKFR